MKLNSGELNEKGPWENIIGHEYYIGVRVRESSNSCWPVGVTVPVKGLSILAAMMKLIY